MRISGGKETKDSTDSRWFGMTLKGTTTLSILIICVFFVISLLMGSHSATNPVPAKPNNVAVEHPVNLKVSVHKLITEGYRLVPNHSDNIIYLANPSLKKTAICDTKAIEAPIGPHCIILPTIDSHNPVN